MATPPKKRKEPTTVRSLKNPTPENIKKSQERMAKKHSIQRKSELEEFLGKDRRIWY